MVNNKNIRSITLCGKYNGNTRVPKLQLTGHWLDKLGFHIGRTIEIIPSKGKLIIKAGENKYKRAV
ncbi:SymE family type I addiction module toxin [Pedobacter sp. L105]|uniref:SymE family type I addiction module toxin n=1 Tax=Pedobacter sp. L105 TaxID=1641871 RepID=UPI00131C8B31|nr:SymE family type I addiction module toxin [Pedobacter sp. L105]